MKPLPAQPNRRPRLQGTTGVGQVDSDVDEAADNGDAEDFVDDAAKAKWWGEEIRFALKQRETWENRARKVERRYHDSERQEGRKRKRRFNVLWSNTQTMGPAVYAQTPKPVASRRWRQRDPTGRLGSALLERCLEVSCEDYNFDDVMNNAVRDRLLPGIGCAWVCYVPSFYDKQLLDDAGQPMLDDDGKPKTFQAVEYEEVCADYVRWDDYLTNPARIDSEIRWKARRHYFTRKAGVKRWGDKFKKITLDSKREKTLRDRRADDDSSITPISRQGRAVVWEVWDREENEVLFIAPSSCSEAEGLLECRPPPYKLKNFWPCPTPLSATVTSESTLPSPDYLQYQDQAEELNEITERISKLQKALKVAGLYDSQNKDLAKLLSDNEGQMIAVENWAMHTEAGGAKGQIEWYPVEKVVLVLGELYKARELVKQILYEVSGIADVMRGATNPNETLGAQQLKARWGSGRVRALQKAVERFAIEIIQIKAEIISEVFRFPTMLQMAGIDQDMLSKYVPAGVNPQALLGQVEQMMRQDMRRNFKIKVASDSALEADEVSERQWRTQFLTGMGAMLKELQPLAQQGPEGAKLAGELMMLGVRGFKEADQVEEVIEQAVDAATKAAAQPKPPPAPDPKVLDIQRQAQKDKMDAEGDAADRQQRADEFKTDTVLRIAEFRRDTGRDMLAAGQASAANDRSDMADVMAG